MSGTTDSSGTATGASIEVRPIEPADAEQCARIVYEAFGGLHDHHQFARDFPTLEAALQLTGMFIAHPAIWGVVAERDGRIVGSNFLDERGPIRGVGPISVDPEAQGQGVGRRLMQAVLERGEGARGVRLQQDSFNVQSLSLYASLGFDVKEPTVVLSGRPRSGPGSAIEVRSLEESDLEPCESLCRSVHGFERTNELRDALEAPVFSPLVAVRDGRLTAWATTFAFFPTACAVAETENDMRALIAGALA
jgi:predicted N-acetyltransferase YhbS